MESTNSVNKRANSIHSGAGSVNGRLVLRVSWLVAIIGALNAYVLGLSVRFHTETVQVQSVLASYSGGHGIAFSVVPEILSSLLSLVSPPSYSGILPMNR